MAVYIDSDFSDAFHEMDRLIRLPDLPGSIELDLEFGFIMAAIKARIHVETGSLVNSVRADTDTGSSDWQGSIKIGGASTPKADVVYAHYERRRGGVHDFMSNWEKYDSGLAKAVGNIVRGNF